MAGLIRTLLVVLCSTAGAGCSTMSYYVQSVRGQMEVLRERRDIDTLIADPATPETLRGRLELVSRIRGFAAERLALPDNGSYHSYTDLHRPYVVWNVFATPKYSLKPLRWCFPFAGCLSYRGYFSRDDAAAFAQQLRARDYDVFLGPVPAYSTLGWFDDPVLNTIIHWPEPELAGVLFHELAHQRLYVRGDSGFNESFASTVEQEGVRRWMLAHAKRDDYQSYLRRRRHEAQFIALVFATRERLQQLYDGDLPAPALQRGKSEIFAWMRAQYAELRSSWHGDGRFDRWMAKELNNAQIASVATYHRFVPAFRKLLEYNHDDLSAFYDAAARIGALPKAERHAYLQALARQDSK